MALGRQLTGRWVNGHGQRLTSQQATMDTVGWEVFLLDFDINATLTSFWTLSRASLGLYPNPHASCTPTPTRSTRHATCAAPSHGKKIK